MLFESKEGITKKILKICAEKIYEKNTFLKSVGSPDLIKPTEFIDPFTVTFQGNCFRVSAQDIIDSIGKPIEHITDKNLKEVIDKGLTYVIEFHRLEKGLLNILRIIRDRENPDDGCEIDSLKEWIDPQINILIEMGLITISINNGKQTAKTTPRSKTICYKCGSTMVPDKSLFVSLDDISDNLDVPKKQIQRAYYCPNVDCPNHKEPLFLTID